MKSMIDVVLEHAKKYKGEGTSEGLKLLELPYDSNYYGAANMYGAALSTIQKLQKHIEYLEGQLKYWENKK